MGLTEAVGEEEEDREREGAAEPMAIREEAGPPSGALISLLASSLLLRDTKQWRERKSLIIFWVTVVQFFWFTLTEK